jgi:membrane protease YdiL (CAAX protease family)
LNRSRDIQRAVGAFAVLIVYLAAVFLGGAAVAPLLYKAVLALAPHSTAASTLVGEPFYRYVTRSFMVIAILAFWPFFRAMGLRDSGRGIFTWDSRSGRQFLGGVLIGLGSLALIALPELAVGARSWDADRSSESVRNHLLNAFFAATLVGFLEELIFRAGVFGGLRRKQGLALALIVSSVIYSIVHFFERPANPAEVTFGSGFVVLGRMLQGLANFDAFVPGFFTLLLSGLILAQAYDMTDRIWLSFGLHAGWIFWLKTFGFFTEGGGQPGSFWGSSKLIDGWAALIVLSFLAFLVFAWGARVRARDGSAPTEKLA